MAVDRRRWRKSSYSQPQGECVEAKMARKDVLVRDSKDPEGGILRVPASTWEALLSQL